MSAFLKLPNWQFFAKISSENPQCVNPTVKQGNMSKFSNLLCDDPKHDNNLVDINMALVGRTTISVQNLHPWASGHATRMKTHIFLAMKESRSSADIKVSTTEHGTQLETEFAFMLPDKLLPSACRHEESDKNLVIDSHIHLPPSMRTLDCSKMEMAKVAYLIRVRVRVMTDGRIKNAEAELPVRIVPINDASLTPSPR